ncbi:hypothetical protein GCM10010193_17370 [Kitasatospora atroaurantiaca]
MSASFTSVVPSLRGRIGHDARSGYYPVPHRYRLHLALSCPHGLQIAVTHSLLGLDGTLPVTLLPALPDAGDDGYLALRPLYEASSHQHPGPAEAPVLSDGWSGRIVSTDPAEILTDLARRFRRRLPERRCRSWIGRSTLRGGCGSPAEWGSGTVRPTVRLSPAAEDGRRVVAAVRAGPGVRPPGAAVRKRRPGRPSAPCRGRPPRSGPITRRPRHRMS